MNVEKIAKIGREALMNAFSLFKDSVTLYKTKSFPTAAYLAIISIEEIGKFSAIDHFVFTHNTNDGFSHQEMIEFIEGTYNHRAKQRASIGNHFYSIKPTIYASFNRGAIEDEKQKCLYVGLARGKKGIKDKGKVYLPKTKRRHRTEEIISICHYLLLDQIAHIVSGRYDEILGRFKTLESRYVYKDLLALWDLNYKAVLQKKEWDNFKSEN